MNTWAGLPGAANLLDAVLGNGIAGTPAETIAEDRFAYARDAAVTSFRNRFGRPPSEAELLDSMPHFLTREDREAYAEARAARSPVLARGFPVRPPARRAPPPQRPSPVVPPAAPGLDATPSSGIHPYLDAMLKTARSFVGDRIEPAARAAEMAWRWADPKTPPEIGPTRTIAQWRDEARRAQVAAYDTFMTDPDKSYQTYTKEREDLGPCRYSDKPDWGTPCYYAGRTGGTLEPFDNVDWRYADRYPTPSYRYPQLDCTTRSYAAARGREQQLIEHFRDRGYSDNLINSIADHVWRPYFLELAERQCGQRAMPEPRPR